MCWFGISIVTMEVYDTFSRKVATIADNQSQVSGTHQVMWDGSSMTAGVYTVISRAVSSSNIHQTSTQITIIR